jgi:hypothetical protein
MQVLIRILATTDLLRKELANRILLFLEPALHGLHPLLLL